MILARLAGGMGNQLYQISAALHLSSIAKQQVHVCTGALTSYAKERQADSLRLLWMGNLVQSFAGNTISTRIISLVTENFRIGRWPLSFSINDNNYWQTASSHRVGSFSVLDGYFQHGWTTESFTNVLSIIHGTVDDLICIARVESDECLIHIRGGDFLDHIIHQVVDARYYAMAVRFAISRGFSKFCVLTDDIMYAKKIILDVEQLLNNDYCSFRVLSPASDPIDDFCNIQAASARIIGNSTFAWWASALDRKKSPTWSPNQFIKNHTRDFFLDWEIPLEIEIYPR